MNTPKALIQAAKRYIEYLETEIRETECSRNIAQNDFEQARARVNKCDSLIKQIRADQEEIKAWVAAQECDEGGDRND